jgi:hypothetical protein
VPHLVEVFVKTHLVAVRKERTGSGTGDNDSGKSDGRKRGGGGRYFMFDNMYMENSFVFNNKSI